MGWIYLLYDEAGKGYIGQTTDIRERLYRHKSTSNDTYSKYLSEWQCEILEEVENDCLEDFEGYWYNFYNELFPGMLVNKIQPGITAKESEKKYRENNPEKIRESKKKYNENNPEKVRESQKKYRENNREKIREKIRKRKLDKKLKNLSLEV
tara:strand:- start:444 stop:899 length:456 start_codon:yes stop_codon:yes gene_type:complete